MKQLSGKLLIVSFSAFFSLLGFAQSLDQAKKLYNEGLYEEAKPAFERLVRQSPNNSSYCLWYGVCCFETGELDTAEKYLLLARGRKVTEASRYLATMHTSMFRYKEATEMWKEYIEQLAKKKEDTSTYEKQLERVEQLLRMQYRAEDVQVIDSMVVSKDQILTVYFLSEDCGLLQMNRDFFQSPDNLESTVYTNPKGDMVFYAHPTFDGRFALYNQSKLLDTWSDEKAIFASDTSSNNYPFVLGDGVTLYFASKGNGSIGGYDLFRTSYTTNTNSYLAPEQLGMPFNSPANDYLMVIDEVKGLGWFVSDRYQPEGKVCVYLFIPNDTRKLIQENDNNEWLSARAALISIRDTWQPGSNYEEMVELAKTDISSTQKKVIRDFEFIVNEKTVYYTLDEFRSTEAKSLYERVLGLKQQVLALENNLDKNRQEFTQGNQTVRDQLRPSILQEEAQLRTFLMQIGAWEKQTRNSENRLLRN